MAAMITATAPMPSSSRIPGSGTGKRTAPPAYAALETIPRRKLAIDADMFIETSAGLNGRVEIVASESPSSYRRALLFAAADQSIKRTGFRQVNVISGIGKRTPPAQHAL